MKEVEVEEEVYSVLSQRASEKGFESTDNYVSYLLDQIVEKIRNEKDVDESADQDEEKVKQKLKDLGYMD